MKYRSKVDLLNIALAAAAGAVTMNILHRQDATRVQEILAEQRTTIERLTNEKIKIFQGDVLPKEQEAPSTAQPNFVSVDDFEALRNRYYFAVSVACQFGMDPVQIATTRRNSCVQSAELNTYMSKMYQNCILAEQLAKTTQEKAMLRKAKERYVNLASNYRISPPQCPKPSPLE
jgi:hypothetical protein